MGNPRAVVGYSTKEERSGVSTWPGTPPDWGRNDSGTALKAASQADASRSIGCRLRMVVQASRGLESCVLPLLVCSGTLRVVAFPSAGEFRAQKYDPSLLLILVL